jgi:hypothetical protein
MLSSSCASAVGAPYPPQAPAGAGQLRLPASRLRRYGMVIVATGITFLFHYGFNPLMDERALFLQLAPVVLISAWYGGLDPGLFATGLAALVTLILVVPPSLSVRATPGRQASAAGQPGTSLPNADRVPHRQSDRQREAHLRVRARRTPGGAESYDYRTRTRDAWMG